MACEKYSGWMTDAALGGLRREEAAELHTHVAACYGCRSEWNAARTLAAVVDHGVEALLAGEPSPQFAARLRARLAEEPAPAAWPLFTWPRLAAGALVAAVLLVTMLLTRAPERRGIVAPMATNTSGATEQPHPRKAGATPTRVAGRLPAGSRHGRVRVDRRYGPLTFEVLVPKGQLSAALILSEGVSAGTIDGAQLARLAERSTEPLDVRALEIQPLAPPSDRVDDAPAAGGDGGRF
jgi:hypothetical protein